MRPAQRGLRVFVSLVVLAGTGCTTLREIPRGEYATRPERKHIAVDTSEGLHYEFDFVRVGNDTLTGYRQRDTDGQFQEFVAVPLPLEGIAKLSTRRVDWYRTGLIGGAGIAAVILGAIARRGSEPEPEPINPCGPSGCPD